MLLAAWKVWPGFHAGLSKLGSLEEERRSFLEPPEKSHTYDPDLVRMITACAAF